MPGLQEQIPAALQKRVVQKGRLGCWALDCWSDGEMRHLI